MSLKPNDRTQSEPPAIELAKDFPGNFVINEYSRLWQDFMRSASAIEAWARYFILVVGGYAAIAGAIASGLSGGEVSFSSSGVEALGWGLLPLACVGLMTCIYMANERGSRIELKNHMLHIRSSLENHDAYLNTILPKFNPVNFKPGFLRGDWARYWIVASVSSLIPPLAAYLIGDNDAIARSANSSTLDLPSAPVWVWLTLAASIVVHASILHYVLSGWDKRFNKLYTRPAGTDDVTFKAANR